MAQHPIQAYKGPSMAVVRISIPGGNATADNPPSTTLKHPNEAPPQPYLPKGADHSITNLPTTKFLEKIVMIGKNPNRKNGRTAIHKRWRLLSAQVVSCCVYKIKNYAARATFLQCLNYGADSSLHLLLSKSSVAYPKKSFQPIHSAWTGWREAECCHQQQGQTCSASWQRPPTCFAEQTECASQIVELVVALEKQ